MRRATGSASSRRVWRARRSWSRAVLFVLRMICSIAIWSETPALPSKHNLIQGILHDALGVGSLEARDDLPHRLLFDHRVDGHPVGVAQIRDGGPLEGRQDRQ